MAEITLLGNKCPWHILKQTLTLAQSELIQVVTWVFQLLPSYNKHYKTQRLFSYCVSYVCCFIFERAWHFCRKTVNNFSSKQYNEAGVWFWPVWAPLPSMVKEKVSLHNSIILWMNQSFILHIRIVKHAWFDLRQQWQQCVETGQTKKQKKTRIVELLEYRPLEYWLQWTSQK